MNKSSLSEYVLTSDFQANLFHLSCNLAMKDRKLKNRPGTTHNYLQPCANPSFVEMTAKQSGTSRQKGPECPQGASVQKNITLSTNELHYEFLQKFSASLICLSFHLLNFRLISKQRN